MYSRLIVTFWLVFAPAALGQTAAHKGVDSAEAHVGRGYDNLKDQRYEAAAAEFGRALELNPKLIRARYQLAVCYFALGRREESRTEFERVRADTSGDPAVIYYLARLDLLDSNLDGTITRLAPLTSDPPFPDTTYYLGLAYLKKGEAQAAEKWLRTAAQADPRDFRAPENLARLYQRLGRGEDAEREYRRAAELRQHYNESAQQAVQCSLALETQTLNEARTTCHRLFEPDDSDKLTTLGMLYGQHRQFQDALEPLQRAARLDPESAEIQHNLGLTYFRLKRYAEARTPLQRAVELRPDFFGSNALLGAALYVLKDDEAAYRVLDHANELNPQDADTIELLFKTATILGEKKLAGGSYTESLSYLRKAAGLRPGDATAQRRLAEACATVGGKAGAACGAPEAQRLTPRQP